MHQTTQHVRTRYRQLVEQVLATTGAAPQCSSGDGQACDAVCDACEQPWCWNCIEHVADGRLLCEGCVALRRVHDRRRRRWKWARMPAFYVVVVVLAALIAYLAGIGRPDPVAVQPADAESHWFRQRVPRLWLNQALRAKVRAARLQQQGNTNSVPQWATLAVNALTQARRLWQAPEIRAQLGLATAILTEVAGQPDDAYAQVRQLEAEVTSASHAVLPYYFHRARMAWASGHRQEAIEDWTLLLRRTTPENMMTAPSRAVDDMIDLFAGGTQAAQVELQIRQLAETQISDWEIRQMVLDAIREHRIGSTFPPALLPEDDGAHRKVPSGAASRPLRIEHFHKDGQ